MKLLKIISEIKQFNINYKLTEKGKYWLKFNREHNYDDIKDEEGEDFADYVTMLSWALSTDDDKIYKDINIQTMMDFYNREKESFDENENFISVTNNMIEWWLKLDLIEKI